MIIIIMLIWKNANNNNNNVNNSSVNANANAKTNANAHNNHNNVNANATYNATTTDNNDSDNNKTPRQHTYRTTNVVIHTGNVIDGNVSGLILGLRPANERRRYKVIKIYENSFETNCFANWLAVMYYDKHMPHPWCSYGTGWQTTEELILHILYISY